VAGRNEIKTVGDVVKIDNGAINPSASIFGQAEYNKNDISAFISGTFTNMWYQRTDDYNYVTDSRSELLLRTGFDTKGGVSWQMAPQHQLYFNAGYFSRTPYFKYVFGNFNNVPVTNLENEKVESAEAGYGYYGDRMTLRANVYYSLWIDKSFLSNEYVQLADNTQTRALVTGLDALHKGIEAEASFSLSEHLQLGALASLGNWKWKNNVSAVLFNADNTAVDTVQVYADDLFVGGAPLVQVGVNVQLQVLKTFTITANWMYYAKQYADFDPTQRTNPDDIFQPWMLPDYGLLDMHINFPFRLASMQAQLGLSGYNLTNARYWTGGEDGTGHNLQSFLGFPGFGRTFSVMMRVEF
jgi:outer membrane receptor for ferrienterochelin and colicin